MQQHLDVCLGTLEQRVTNDANGWGELPPKLTAAEVDLVVVLGPLAATSEAWWSHCMV